MKANLKKLDRMKSKYWSAEDKAEGLCRRYLKQVMSYNDGIFCQICGETDPEHGFYPLDTYGMDIRGRSHQHSSVQCNKCARTPEDYEEMFGEKNEEEK